MNRKIFITLNSFVILTALLVQVFTEMGGVTPAYAATLTVTINLDDGSAGSLRSIVTAAASGDTIIFNPSLSGQTITLTTGEIAIGKNLTIDGSALATPVTISGGASRAFHVTAAGMTLTLNGLTVANSTCSNCPGGALLVDASATANVINSTFSGNTVTGGNGSGGAIRIQSGSIVNVTNSTFFSNAAAVYAGAIDSAGGTTNVVNSTFYNNTAGSYAGALSAAGTINVANSTFFNNRATTSGGAISVAGGSTVRVTNSTFYNNVATSGNGMTFYNPAGAFTVKNSILVRSSGTNCYNNVAVAGFNNRGNDTSCGANVTNSATINLGTLGNYGGNTQTIPILSGSSAIDAGDAATCSNAVGAPNFGAGGTDQRGITRPQGTQCDIGAYETYTVTYNGNGNTGGTAPANQTKDHVLPLTLQLNTGSLVKTGYALAGWNTAPDGSGTHYDLGGSYTTNASITLYAEWVIPTLGAYPSTDVVLSDNAIITPSAAPTKITNINVSTSPDFIGAFVADPLSGVVRVVNAHPAGTYTVTVKGFVGVNGDSTSTTFPLTVTDGNMACTAAIGFTNAANASTGTNPYSVAVGDFNGDGKQDLATANYTTNNVSIRLGNGDGTFTSAADVTVGTNPVSVTIGDFNGDGKQDLATANYTTNNVSIRLGNGDGTFTNAANVTAGAQPQQVAVGDFNGDGKQDIAIANGSSNIVSVYLGNGYGAFTFSANLPVGNYPKDIAVGDFNGDGKQDLAVPNFANFSTIVSIRLGVGNGTFTNPGDVTVGGRPSSVALGDFNEDGNQDIAVANFGNNYVSIRLGVGNGTFTNGTNVAVAATNGYSIAVGDFNNDGNQDFATANSNTQNVSIRLGTGIGTFTNPGNFTVGVVPYSVAVGDFNGDGKQDFAAANATSNTVSIRLGNFPLCYDGNSNTGGTAPAAVAPGATVTVSGNTGSLVRTGYTFNGWNTAADGSGTSYAPAATFNITVPTILYAKWVPVGNALHFDGATGIASGDYVLTGSNVLLGGNVTYEAWIKTSVASDWRGIISSDATNASGRDNLQLVTNAAGYLRASIVDGANYYTVDATTTQINNGNWHHVAVTFSAAGEIFHLYVDGIDQSLSVLNHGGSVSGLNLNAPLVIGNNREVTLGTWPSFNGTIDEVRIWNMARSQAQITANMNSAIAPQAGLVAYYKFDQGTAGGNNTGLTTAIDSSGNILNGTLTNFGLTNPTSSNWVYGNVPLTVHTVTFNANGGVGSNTTQTASTATALTANAFTRAGYTFAGWNTQPGGGGTSYTNGQSYNFADDLILYAQWSAINYTVTYAGNGNDGGTVPTDSTNYNIGNTVTIKFSPLPSKTGYTFAGWSDGVTTYPSNGISSFTMGSSNVTLTAQWTTVTNALDFEGTDDWVDVTNNGGLQRSAVALGLLPVKDITIEAWVYPRSYTIYRAFTGFLRHTGGTQAGWNLQTGNGNRFNFSLAGGGTGLTYLQTTNTFLTNTWYHVAGVYDGTTMKLYVNGQLEATSAAESGNIYYVDNWFALGAWKDDNEFYPFPGTIDEVRIWNVARSQAQIQSNMYNEITTPQSGLLAYYRFNQGIAGGNNPTVKTALDVSGNGYNGALNNFALTSTASNWVAGPHVVTFNANGGSGSMLPQVNNTTTALTANAFTRTGYTFTGWGTAPGGPVVYADGAAYSFAADITLYAQWTAVNQTLTFNSNGGSAVTAITQAYGTTVNAPSDPTKEGHTFDGWYSDAGLTTAYAFPHTMGLSTTIYAKWTADSQTLSFNSNGGTAVDPITQDYGTNVTAPTAPTKEGHTFGGWFTDDGTFLNAYTFPHTMGLSTTIHAKWTAVNQTLTFNSNGGSAVAPITQAYGTTVNAPANPTRTGYTFGGWYTDDGTFLNAYDFPHTMGLSATIHAKWTPSTHTVTFNANGGTGTVSPQTDNHNATVALNTNSFSRTGHTFAGWDTDPAGVTVVYTDGADYTFTADANLYAVWTINQYTISFEENGGSTVANITQDYNTAVTKPVDPTREGHTFVDWYTDDGTFLNAYSFTTMPAANITLYAKWTADDQTLTFNSNGGTPVDPITQAYGTTVNAPADPTRTAYTFGGWYTDAGLTTAYDFPHTMGLSTTIHAKWTIKTYTVSYNDNGATGGSAPDDQTKTYDVDLTLATNSGGLVKTGYTFTGWNTLANGLGTHYDEGASYTDNTAATLHAEWTVNQYTISFEENGGPAVSDITQNYGTLVNAPVPTRTGYTFDGWYTDDGTFLNAYTFSTMPAENITLYAGWTINQYTISFEENGGSEVTDITQDYNAIITAPAEPALTGYNFGGWYTDDGTFLDTYSFSTMPAENITLYARWVIGQYTIFFNSNGGTPVDPITQDYDTLVTAPDDPTRTGYTFDGWYTDDGAFLDAYTFSTMPAENVSLYAKWTANTYTVSFDPQDGTPPPADQPATFDSAYGALPTVTRTGYTFSGWHTAPTGGSLVTDATVVSTAGDHTLYAQWTGNPYTVTFDGNGGGAPSPDSKLVTFGSAYDTLATVSRLGYAFNGWFDAPVGGTQVTAATIVSTAGDHTLHAQWTVLPDHTVTFDANGGSGSMPDQVTNIPTALTLNTFNHTGYTFIGWNTETDGSGIFHADGASYPFDEDATLYAQWTAKTYTVTFEPQNGSAATSASVTYDSAYGTLPTVTRPGYTFLGWFDAPTGGNEVTAATIVNTTADHTLYAHWTDVPPTVTVNQAAGQADPTYNTPIRFTAVFSEPINKATFTSADVTRGGTAGATTVTIIEAAPFDGTTFTIYLSGMARAGTVTASILANKVLDLTGKGNFVSTSVDNSVTYNVPIYNPVSLVSPASNALVKDYSPLLDWSNAAPPAGAGFLHYQVQVSTDSVFANIIHTGTTIGTTATSQYKLPITLNPNTRYYWRVRWVSGAGFFSKWSATRYFRAAMLPPVLTAPEGTLDNKRPTLEWGAVEGATSYTIQFSLYPTFSPIARTVTSVPTTHTLAADLLPSKLYYWRVSANGLNGPSDYSATPFSFTTANPPSVPVLSLPANGALVNPAATLFDWANVSVPTGVTFARYEIQIARNVAFTDIFQQADVAGLTNSQFTSDLLVTGTTYYWRVRSVGATPTSYSAWSLARTVKAKFSAPVLLQPANDLTPLGDTTPDFEWQLVNGATGYTIQIARNAKFSSGLIAVNLTGTTYTPTTPLVSGVTYYWRVRVNGAYTPIFSETRSFKP